jgi:hypothetical protein
MSNLTMRPAFTLVLTLASALFATAVASADVAGQRTIDLPLLLDLPGDLAPVRYTPGALDRAAALQMRFELLAEEFTRTRFQAAAIVVYVLSPEDWAAAGLQNPYGDPQLLGTDALVLPAWADAEMIERVRGWLGGEIPVSGGLPLLATREEAGALGVSDILAQIAGGRLLARRAHLVGDQPWIEPVMGHLVSRLAWDRFEPGRIREIAAQLDAMAAQDNSRSGGHALADWDENLPLPRRAWFETRFMRAADLMVTTKGARAMRKILTREIAGLEPLTEALLLKKLPELAGWLAANFAPPTAPPPAVTPPTTPDGR